MFAVYTHFMDDLYTIPEDVISEGSLEEKLMYVDFFTQDDKEALEEMINMMLLRNRKLASKYQNISQSIV